MTSLPERPVTVRNVFISVSEKRGLASFVRELVSTLGKVTIYATTGTCQALRSIEMSHSNCRLIAISDYVKIPDLDGGLIKTLHYKLFLGLLADPNNPKHRKAIKKAQAAIFDLVIIDFYPIEENIESIVDDDTQRLDINDDRFPSGKNGDGLRSNIDIGGAALSRAAAKNFDRIATIVDDDDRDLLLDHLRNNNGATTFQFRMLMAAAAFARTAQYDHAIANRFITNLKRIKRDMDEE